MEINTSLLKEFDNKTSKILVVTKYFNKDETNEISDILLKDYNDIIVWLWENRVNILREKNLDRESTHFIWNIQTKEIKHIIKHCMYIHSVDDIKQLYKMEEICSKSWNWVQIFLQINIDNSKPGWIDINDIPKYLEIIWELENVSLIWFSWIGKSDFTLEEKNKEFKLLKELRNKYLQNWLVSAGTSVDYEIALENEIDIIRIGSKLFNL